MQKEKQIKTSFYLLAFFCAALIFFSGFLLAGKINERKLKEIDTLQQNFRIDILSLETQFSILAEAPCENLNESTLTKELYEIARNLENIAGTLGPKDNSYIILKKYYSVLQMKHWILLKKTQKQCQLPLTFVIYFYDDKKICPECENQGYILTHLRRKYPELRIYSFDFNLNLSALDTLKSIYNIQAKELPAIVINDKLYSGYKTIEELETILGKYIDLEKSATTTTDGL